jgi:predicted HTH domain antitoxin
MPMTLVLELPDAWKQLLGLDSGDAAGRAREMLVVEAYREGRLSRGQAAEMLNIGFHEAESLFKRYGADQQPTWDELEHSAQELRSLLDA